MPAITVDSNMNQIACIPTRHTLNLATKANDEKHSGMRFLDLPPEIRVMIYRQLLVDPDGVHIKTQVSRHRRLIFHCHRTHITREWELESEAKHVCKARSRPPSHECLSDFVYRQKMGLSDVLDNDEPALKKLGQITHLQRRQRADQGAWAENRIRTTILHTCRQVYDEASYILYQQDFIFSDPEALFDFLAALGPLPLNTIRDITVMSWTDKRTISSEAAPSFALLPKVVNLRQLTIDGSMGDPDWAWTQIFPSRRLDLAINTCYHQPADIIANKVYRDMMYWLRPMYAKVGITGLQRILRIHRCNFMPRYTLADSLEEAFDDLMPNMEDFLMARFWGVLQMLLEGDLA